MTGTNSIPDSPLSGGPKVSCPRLDRFAEQEAALKALRESGRDVGEFVLSKGNEIENLRAADLLLRAIALRVVATGDGWIWMCREQVKHDMANAPSWTALIEALGGFSFCRAAIAEREGK